MSTLPFRENKKTDVRAIILQLGRKKQQLQELMLDISTLLFCLETIVIELKEEAEEARKMGDFENERRCEKEIALAEGTLKDFLPEKDESNYPE